MSTRITLNGNTVLADTDTASYEMLREAINTLLTTKSIDAKGSQDAAAKLQKTAEAWAKKPATDTIEVWEKPETKGATEKRVASYKRGNVVQRIKDALNFDKRGGEIFKDETSKKNDTNLPAAELADV